MTAKALFLDRDGVINEDIGYVHTVEQFRFTEGIHDTLKHAAALGYKLIVVTNQAGIGRGYYTEADFRKLTAWMITRLAQSGVLVHAVYYCPYHPEHGKGDYKRWSYWRKPNPGMLLEAAKDFGLDLSLSIMVGDQETDIEAGIRAGVGRCYLLSAKTSPQQTKAHKVLRNIRELMDLL